jgi:diacylglycerol kinase
LRTIELRIDDLVSATHKSRQLRAAAASYEGNWRDIVLVVCAVLFTYVWWHVSHHRADWLLMFIVLIGVCVVTAVYAFRGSVRSARRLVRSTPKADE